MIFEAIGKAGVRALVSRGWGGSGRDDVPDTVFMLGNVPHNWLFSRVSACVIHGGAVSTASALKLGRQTMIVPFFGDQHFWGSMAGSSGAGPKPVPYRELTSDILADGIKYLLTDEAKEVAGKIAKSIEMDSNGAENAVKSFQKHLKMFDPFSLRCSLLRTPTPISTSSWSHNALTGMMIPPACLNCCTVHAEESGIQTYMLVVSANKVNTLSGMSHLHWLVEAIEDMIRDQERDFGDACAADDVLTAREYLGSSSEYLGDLRRTILSKGLGLITRQYLLARKAMPTRKNPFPASLGSCGEDCSVPVELGAPCCNMIYSKIGSGTPFTKWDVHPRWHIRASPSRDPYRRILHPKIAITLRGRPKNTPQAVPARLAVGTGDQSCTQPRRSAISRASQTIPRKRRRSTTRQNEPTLAGPALEVGRPASGEVELQSQRQTRSQSAIRSTLSV
ncbi:hypothetical protein PCL_11360 [Purpureocillium lilacinum]|uniref:Erythromycin biosynthesis protein CIII-like C-terminal domain-containing protein n=1 Tax=Purpureocillium lilacinum TaxID=33203 RepID=A0A2U3DPQ6_PURLI|nr:hypothetical protein PCL_11360 [Purpureocillium lilacinum]